MDIQASHARDFATFSCDLSDQRFDSINLVTSICE